MTEALNEPTPVLDLNTIRFNAINEALTRAMSLTIAHLEHGSEEEKAIMTDLSALIAEYAERLLTIDVSALKISTPTVSD